MNYTEISKKADEEFDLGRIKEAISLLKKGLDIAREKGHKSYIEFFLGELENVKGDYESALPHHKQAVKLNPNNPFLLKNLGVTYSLLGKEEEAIELYDRALEIKPDDYDSLRNKGVSLSKLGKVKEAIELFDRALEIKSDDWNALIWKAYTLENIDRNKDAEKIYKNLKLNLHKIKDRELKDLINFKIGIYEKTKPSTQEEVKKSSDILNKVIDAFKDKKEDFFDSINKIESNFETFTDTRRSIPNDFPSFLSVLRKWNSYTPIIPSEKGDNKGGGYFLYHKGKGIVIDPGFNFIENFYQEGFKVADIDAILITHAHNDHTVDFESILTLIYKYNDAIEDSVKHEMKGEDEIRIKHEVENRLNENGKKIDLFLNVGTFMKYSGWLNLKDSGEIKYVTVLQPDTTYDLPDEYNGITIHTTKAKHHEVIDNKYAIGFILDIEGNKIGFTGDTGWDFENNGSIAKPFIEHKPKLLIAHLGSIKSREFKYVEAENKDERNQCFYTHHLGLLGMAKLLDSTKPDLTIISEFGEELRNFRKDIVEGIGDVLKLKCLPGDIGLHIRLKDLAIYCFIDKKFIDFNQIEVYDKQGEPNISFHKEELDHEKFNTALERKNRMRAVPLSDRISGDPND